MVEEIQTINPEYSINKKKYLQLFFALCNNSKEGKKQNLPKFDDSVISKRLISQLEEKSSSNLNSDWIHKKVQTNTPILPKKKVVVVRHNVKIDEKKHKKELIELKAHILEAKKMYITLKKKGASKEHLLAFQKRIDEMEKKLK